MDCRYALCIGALAIAVQACKPSPASGVAGAGVAGAGMAGAQGPANDVPASAEPPTSNVSGKGPDATIATDGGVPVSATSSDAGSSPVSADDAGASTALATIVSAPMDDAAYIFDQTTIRTYNLIIAPADLATLDSNPEAEMYVPAMLEFEGKTYGPLSVRYKGSVGAWRPPCLLLPDLKQPKAGKCSIKVAFDTPDDNARFFGLKKLNFHSMNGDASMLRERLGYALFGEMGIASPRTMHARVLINGALEGLFIAVENIDGRFARAHFGEGGKGNVYKEVWPMFDDPQVYIQALENNPEAKTPDGVQKMLDFKAAIDESADAAQRFLDRDYAMRYAAVDRVIINDDGIFHWWCEPRAQGNNTGMNGNHNYYWYEAKDASRFWLIPWDLDNSFDGLAENHIEMQWNVPIACECKINSQGTNEWPASCDHLTQYFISWMKDYDAMVDAFIAGPFASGPVEDKLNAWSSQIEPAVTEAAGIDASKYAAWLSGVKQLRATIDGARRHRGYAY
jgi:spore coat protein CotH